MALSILTSSKEHSTITDSFLVTLRHTGNLQFHITSWLQYFDLFKPLREVSYFRGLYFLGNERTPKQLKMALMAIRNTKFYLFGLLISAEANILFAKTEHPVDTVKHGKTNLAVWKHGKFKSQLQNLNQKLFLN